MAAQADSSPGGAMALASGFVGNSDGPSTFEQAYITDASADMLPLADVVIVAGGGVRLRAHSHYLARASPVLRDAFLSQTGSLMSRRMELPMIFEDHAPEAACLFLRHAYQPGSCTPEALAPQAEHLPALVCLADALQADGLLQQLVDQASAPGTPLPVLVAMLSGLQSRAATASKGGELLLKLKQRFFSGAALTKADVQLVLDKLDRELLITLFGEAATAPPPKHVAFEWTVTGFSPDAGRRVLSPQFFALGQSWRLKLKPRAPTNQQHLYMSLFCQGPGVPGRAKVTITIHSAKPSCSVKRTHVFTGRHTDQKYRIATWQQLRDAKRGLVANKTLRVTAALEAA